MQQQHLKRRQHADDSQVLDMVVGCMLPCLQMQRQQQVVESGEEVFGVGGYLGSRCKLMLLTNLM